MNKKGFAGIIFYGLIIVFAILLLWVFWIGIKEVWSDIAASAFIQGIKGFFNWLLNLI